MSGLIGTWHLSTTENFDEYMQALGKYQIKSTSITKVTRTHSSRMCTAHLQTVRAAGPGGLRLRSDIWGGGLRVPGLMFMGCRLGAGVLYSEVQGIMGNGHMGTPLGTDRHTHLKELPSHNSVGGR